MNVLRDLGFEHLIFFVGLCLLIIGLLVQWRTTERDASIPVTAGWITFGTYWLYLGVSRLFDAYAFLGLTSIGIAALCWYVSSLTYRRRFPGIRVTKAFVVMGSIYVPFEYVDIVHRFGLETVTSHTAVGNALIGIHPTIEGGVDGRMNLLVLPGPVDGGVVASTINSACTGISAIALFVGLISISTATTHRKVAATAVVVPSIYVLNIVRNVFTTVAYSTHAFSFAVEPLSGVYGGSDGPYFSYFVAEQIVSPVYILVGTVVVYVVLVRALPDIEATLIGLLDATERDYERIATTFTDRFG